MNMLTRNGKSLLPIAALSLAVIMTTASAQGGRPTVVLVHGAFAESSSWNAHAVHIAGNNG